MIWTRKTLTETSDWFNQKPLAPLDETWRLPLALGEIFRLLKEEYGIVLKKPLIVREGYFYFRPYQDYFFQLIFQPRVYLLLGRVFRETKKAKDDWEKSTRRFLREIGRLKRRDWSKLDTGELFEEIEKTIKFDAYWLYRLGFGLHLVYHQFSEVLLKFLYRLLVKDRYSQNYHELLIGYSSKLKEADLAFWEVVKGELEIGSYLDHYGLRATDATLVLPTIGEDQQELQKWINSFKGLRIPDFGRINRLVLEKRKRRERYIQENFRSWIPFGRTVFTEVLEIARDYISVRETRRFYYTQATFYIRKGLLELGRRFKGLGAAEDVFFLTKEELGKAVSKPEEVNWKRFRFQVTKRKKRWEEWGKQPPPEKTEL